MKDFSCDDEILLRISPLSLISFQRSVSGHIILCAQQTTTAFSIETGVTGCECERSSILFDKVSGLGEFKYSLKGVSTFTTSE